MPSRGDDGVRAGNLPVDRAARAEMKTPAGWLASPCLYQIPPLLPMARPRPVGPASFAAAEILADKTSRSGRRTVKKDSYLLAPDFHNRFSPYPLLLVSAEMIFTLL